MDSNVSKEIGVKSEIFEKITALHDAVPLMKEKLLLLNASIAP